MHELEPAQEKHRTRKKEKPLLTIRILADFDHDGIIDAPHPPAEGTDRFGIVLPVPNLSSCCSFENTDWQLMGSVGPLDVGIVSVWSDELISQDSALILCVNRDAQGKVHLFRSCESRWESLGAEGTWHLPWESIGCQQVTLGLVANSFAQAASNRVSKWSGSFTLTAAILDKSGVEMATDSARFRVAPFLLASALDPVEQVLVTENSRTTDFVKALERIVPQTGAQLRAIQFEDGTESDVWIQDAVEIGRVCVPTFKGIQQAIAVLSGIRAKHEGINCEPLDRNIREHFGRLGAIIVNAAVPREKTRWIDWYGNLEVSPPVKARNGREFPFGRVLTGHQKDLKMHPDILAFLEAQRLQVPPLIVDTSWLQIGHVDEVVNFVPSTSPRGFHVLIPSPALAKTILEKVVSQGLANQAVFGNHQGETTVEALLGDVARSEENDQIQRILCETRALLCEGLGVEDDDFVEVPALFRDGIAVIPNCVNGLICNGHAILPDPLGPEVNGKDIFAEPVQTTLTSLGVRVYFVDIWESYHMGAGEIHCGTNAIRCIQVPAWWEIERL